MPDAKDLFNEVNPPIDDSKFRDSADQVEADYDRFAAETMKSLDATIQAAQLWATAVQTAMETLAKFAPTPQVMTNITSSLPVKSSDFMVRLSNLRANVAKLTGRCA